jgi:hypothetical protein
MTKPIWAVAKESRLRGESLLRLHDSDKDVKSCKQK